MLGGKTLHILRHLQSQSELWVQPGHDGWFPDKHNIAQGIRWHGQIVTDASLVYQLTKLVNAGYLERRESKHKGWWWWYEYRLVKPPFSSDSAAERGA